MERRPPDLRVVPPPPSWPEWMEQWVIPYVREPVLWPVLVALLGHVVLGLVALELAVVRVGSVTSAALLAALALGSAIGVGVEARRFGRPGAVSLTLVLTWLAAVGGAYLADRTGVL